MNRRKNETKPPVIHFFAIGIGTIIAALGGIGHVYYKNRQIQTAREIDAIERRIEQYHLDIRTTQMRMDQHLNRFAIRQQLAENSSALVPIPVGFGEDVRPSTASAQQLTASVP